MKDENISLLWELQNLEQDIQKINNYTTLKKIRKKLKTLKHQHESIKKEVQDKIARYREWEQEFTKINQKNKNYIYMIEELQEKIYDGKITNVTALSKLEIDLKQLKKEMNDLEEEILEGMEEKEIVKANIQKMKDDLLKIQNHYKTEKEQYDIEKEKIQKQKNLLLRKIKKIQKELDKTYLQKYEKIQENIQPPMAIINNGSCMGCNMNISIILLKNIQVNAKIYLCETCGRILYMEKD